MPTKKQAAPLVWTPAEMGRKGGQAKVSKGIGKLSKKRRREIAMLSVAARRRKADARTREATDDKRSRRKAPHVAANAGRVEVA
jgi:hypothetical protein